ncbi:TIGR01777 family protein [Phormidium sp. LEGE 05292]|uniref:thylakoid membrane protein ThyD n=1 Tax=[Phormidium] sp. LEGE 05292 TaxID=767427 RepID=UPI00187ED3C0|nr:TIGR01777 family oxidoreductase [Phormidium sp. LEGE 05292]MBE9224457.1 TIGR01777 family protein [Phormidium sp. LEGE 05292]
MKVAITGATGFVGSYLVKRLQAEGDRTIILTRNTDHANRVFPKSAFPNVEIVAYNPHQSGDWQKVISGCDGVVNLAGAPIGEGRWTAERKQEIINSRKIGTQKLVEAIANAEKKPSVLVNASAIGYYGTSETAAYQESSPPGDDFLAQVCIAWEAEAQKVKDLGVRLAILRFGVVLGMGGAIAKMLPVFKLFAGGTIGTGKQWFSWIEVDDLVNLIVAALKQPEIEGVYNATAPNPVRMADFCHALGDVLHRPSWLPVPAFALELLMGDAAMVVLEGQKVLPKRTLESGFTYKYPDLKPALKSFLS